MKSIKPFIALTFLVAIITVMIPALLVSTLGSGEKDSSGKAAARPERAEPVDKKLLEEANVEIAVFRNESKQIENLPLEKYITGVVSAEMPADFELEALKAQALTARTFIISHLMKGTGKVNGADVADTVKYQVYKNEAELRAAWGKDYAWKSDKVAKAVLATKGQILTYEGKPITATFFSTSNGFTENSKDLWGDSYPYLQSVESPWDKESPKYRDQKVISIAQFEQKLGVKINENSIGKIVKQTSGKRVASVDFNGKIVSGRTIRETLELKSTDFEWKRKDNHIIISTKGYGHGVGMSQYGANGMAMEGKNYKEIVSHYYQGTAITSADSVAGKILAQK